jgi:outer membrane protein OmpA-like peptidoglycan-associated protein
MSWVSRIGKFAVVAVVVAISGCATGPAPKELVDARAAYSKAQSGEAGKLTPAQVHEAKVSLDAAERAYLDDSESARTRDLAYVAQRKSEWAEAQGNAASASAQRDAAQKELASLTQSNLARAQQGLQAAKGELAQNKQALNMTAEQLAAEKKAREAAEKRMRDAMDKLAVAAALAVKQEERGTVIVLPGSVLFATNKWDVLPAAQVKLDQVAEALKSQQDDSKMVVEGHTDSQGDDKHNLELGQKRADSVRNYLVGKGVKAEHITAVGIGEGRPVADNNSAEGRANNRRVEIIISAIERR